MIPSSFNHSCIRHIIVVTDNGDGVYVVSGEGTVIGSCALDCDTGYWECIVGESPEELQLGIRRYNKQVTIHNCSCYNIMLSTSFETTYYILTCFLLGIFSCLLLLPLPFCFFSSTHRTIWMELWRMETWFGSLTRVDTRSSQVM